MRVHFQIGYVESKGQVLVKLVYITHKISQTRASLPPSQYQMTHDVNVCWFISLNKFASPKYKYDQLKSWFTCAFLIFFLKFCLILFYFIVFYFNAMHFIAFYSILFYSILFYSILFYSILFHCMLLHFYFFKRKH